MSEVVENKEVPEGWVSVPLEDCAEILDSRRIPLNSKERSVRIEGKLPDQLYPYYGATGQVGFIDDFIFEGEHLLIGEDGAPFFDKSKNVAYIANSKFWVNNHAHILSAQDGVTTNKYLLHYLNNFNYKDFVGGTTRLKLNQRDLKKIPVSLAPAEQQKRIVAKIEELFSHIDTGIEALKKTKQLLKQYRHSVLKAAVTGKLTKKWREANKGKLEHASKLLNKIETKRYGWIEEQILEGNKEASRLRGKLKKHEYEELDSSIVPDGWVSVSLTKLCQLVVDCHNKTAPYVDDGIPLVRTSNIKGGEINFKEKMKYVNNETYEFWSRRCPPKSGDILLTREAPMGESAIVPENTILCMGQRMMLLRVIHDLTDVKYLQIALMDPLFQKRIHGFKVGVGVQHLRVGDVEKAVIALPSIAEQKEIVRVTDERLDAISRLENDISYLETTSGKNRQSILASAFKGVLIGKSR